MRYRVLGPLEVDADGGPVVVGGPKERAVLCALLLRAGEVVSPARLEEDLWGDSPPRTSAKVIQTYISKLRRTLGDDGIETVGTGYRVRVAAGDLDVDAFERAVIDGRRLLTSGLPADAAARLDEGLSLWRGSPYDELSGGAARAAAARLGELRLAALEHRVDAGLQLGEASHLVAELQGHVRRHPLRERFWGQLMTALARCGRQADALRVYQEARAALVEQAGVEPGPALREIERALLAGGLGEAPSSGAGAFTRTVVLTDIEGSAAMWDREPGAMAAAVARHEQVIREVVDRHGGEFVKGKGEGDSTFSVFERPASAVAAAVEIQLAVSDHAWSTSTPLRLRVAVHTGEVEARDGDYYGRTVNRAARLRALGTGQTVLLSGATAELAGGHEVVDLGEYRLRGLAEPERVHAVVHPRLPVPNARPAFPSALVARDPVLGREDEMREARTWIGDRSSRLLLISGEPGIGKTRLAAEIAAELDARREVVLFGRSDEDELSPYQPFVEALRPYLEGIGVNAARVLGRHRLPLSRLFRWLATEAMPAAEQADRLELFDAVGAALAAAGGGAPVTVVVDDLHWADEPTLRLLLHELRSGSAGTVRFVATYRDTDLDRARPLMHLLGDLWSAASTVRIDLRGLDAGAVGVLIGDATRAEEVLAETDGNPLFVSLVARHLADRGTSDRSIPQGVREVIGRRLDRLPAGTDALLTAASVVGTHFELGVAARAAGIDEPAALDAVEAAVAAGLVDETAVPDRFSFSHVLVARTLYDGAPTSRRVRLHRAVADAIEGSPGGADRVVDLARHYGEAVATGCLDKAVGYTRRAAQQASDAAAFEEAVTLYERALELLELAPDDAASDARRACLSALGDVLFRSGQPGPSRDRYGEAAALARQAGAVEDFARATLGFVAVRPRMTAEPDQEDLLLDEALAWLGPGDHPLRAQLLTASTLWRSHHIGEHDVLAAIEGFEIAERLGDPVLCARVATLATGIAIHAMTLEQATRATEGIDAVVTATPSALPAEAHLALHVGYMHLARPDDARRVALRQAETVAPSRSYRPRLTKQVIDVFRATVEGRLADAEAAADQMLELGAGYDANPAVVMVAYASQLLPIRFLQNRYSESIDLARVQLEAQGLPVWHPVIAMMELERGNDAAARDLLLDFRRFDLDDLALRPDWGPVVFAVANAAPEVRDLELAEAVYERARRLSGRMCNYIGYLYLGAYDQHLGALAATCGRRGEAIAHLEAGAAQLDAMGAVPWAERCRATLARVMADGPAL